MQLVLVEFFLSLKVGRWNLIGDFEVIDLNLYVKVLQISSKPNSAEITPETRVVLDFASIGDKGPDKGVVSRVVKERSAVSRFGVGC